MGDAASAPRGADGNESAGQGNASDAQAAGVRVEVRRERKGRGGKTVTQLRWLSGRPEADALAAIAKLLGAALGTGARVEAGEAIVLQGDLVERAAGWLEGRPGTEVVRATS